MLFPIQWEEPFGLVLIESMACGTPVFAFPGGAVPEVVSEGISGTISTSVVEMASAITTQTFTPSVVRSWAETMFSIENMVDRYVELYGMILKRKIDPGKMTIRSARGTAA